MPKATATKAPTKVPANKTRPAKTPAAREPRGARLATPEPAPQPTEPVEARTIDGLAVVSDIDVLSGLSTDSKVVSLRIGEVTLQDGSTRYVCRDCTFTALTRGEVQTHRAGSHPSGKRPVGRPARPGGLPPEIAMMTLAELMDLAVTASRWGQMFDEQAEQIKLWQERALAAELANRRINTALTRVGFTLKVDES